MLRDEIDEGLADLGAAEFPLHQFSGVPICDKRDHWDDDVEELRAVGATQFRHRRVAAIRCRLISHYPQQGCICRFVLLGLAELLEYAVPERVNESHWKALSAPQSSTHRPVE